ncbi:hypothetical protein PF007_g16061 [Phytophthora fragariae]|uniref:Kinesin motor domain-containing protein n=1 Tax=Phytophthora fragariae TaxID=53985 RepID=A0A6A3RK14_9STRA|nr:hypothetical protein PF007_g16061 [Phytophthora fragariae]
MATRTSTAASDGVSKSSSASSDGNESNAVQVAMRVRPLSVNEAAQGSESCVDVVNSSVLLADKQLDFDAAFAASTQQESVFSALVSPMIDQIFDGYNATVFAYGQTGSGKTYTMGNEFAARVGPAERGVIPRVIDTVFQRVQASSNPEHFVVKLSYLEILNEEVRDLLASSADTPMFSSSGLSVRGDSDRGIVVSGLSEHIVSSVMTSQEAIFSAKEAVRVNLAERKTLALQVGQLENSPSSENAEKLVGLRRDLRYKSDSIRLLQQNLVVLKGICRCHQESKEESMKLKSCKDKIAIIRKAHIEKTQALESKLGVVTKELKKLQGLTTKKKAAKKRKARESYETMDTLFSSSDEEEDNSAADSDYVDDEDRHKASKKRRRVNGTPAAKASASKCVDVMDEIDELLETSAATCCSCNGKCATKACACRSQNRGCSNECSCESSKCRNKSGVATCSPREFEAPANHTSSAVASSSPKTAASEIAMTSNTILALEESTMTEREVAIPVTINLMSP